MTSQQDVVTWGKMIYVRARRYGGEALSSMGENLDVRMRWDSGRMVPFDVYVGDVVTNKNDLRVHAR